MRADSDKVGAFYTEIDIPTSVISVDSILTSSSARLLAGHYTDPDLGEMTASGYTRFSFGESRLNIPEEAVYDSIYLNLNVDYTYGPGVSGIQNFSVHELTEDIIDTLAYFRYNEIAYDPEPVGTGAFLLPTDQDTTIFYKLNDDFGNALFDSARDTLIIDPDEESTLYDLFKGFAFIADPANNSLLRYNQESGESDLSLYYHEPGDTVAQFYKFRFFTIANFNRIVTDRTGTPLEGIEEQPLTEFTPSDNKTYIQSGGGLIPKLDLTPILDYFDTISDLAFNKVVLEVRIIDPAFNENPPSQLTFYFTDENNRRIRSGSEFLGLRVEGSSDLVRPPFVEDNNNYEAPATLYTGEILPGINPYHQLLLFPPEFGFTLSINHFKVDPGNIRAKIYYTRLK
ncbi:MAG: DUF4270 family protein [Cyclobacteriaceae bacterium]|nr:DUF4270 family protein [Cyclobacteriaceae bacterium]